MYTSSGTGSIADNLNAEGYYYENKWLVLLDGREAPVLNSQINITEDGILKISWEKCEQYNFSHYEISGSINYKSIDEEIKDANINYFIDSSFVAGKISFRASCRTFNDHTWGNYLSVDVEPSQIYFENIGLDSLKILWDKSEYNAKYLLKWDDTEIIIDETNDTSYVIEQPGFAEQTAFSLISSSKYVDEWPTVHYLHDFETYVLGNNVAGNWPEYGYNHIEKVFYTNTYNDMLCYDINTEEIINSVTIYRLLYGGNYSCPTNSSKVAVLSDSIYIFESKELQNPVVIYRSFEASTSADHFHLSDNDIISFASDGKYTMIDINSKEVIAIIDIIDYPYYSRWAKISTSQDARYSCISTNNGVKLYNIESGNVNEIYSDFRSYRSTYFNPYNLSQLFITQNENTNLEIRNPSDFSLIETINLPSKTVIENIDPETGYMLLTNYSELYILNIETKEIILTINCDDYIPKLYNNKLFSHSGYVLDISENL
jgi:hypothetical protein